MTEELDAPENLSPRVKLLFTHVELIVVILLGLVSVATAYTSFQSALYGGQSAEQSAKGGNAETAAESLYLEGNQQYVQDAQTILQLASLKIDSQSEDPITAADGQAKYDEIYFIGVSPELNTAIKKADAKNDANPKVYTYPLDDNKYQDSLFSSYDKKKAQSDKLNSQGDALGTEGDSLGLYTALMAITLFLLGVAAVVRKPKMKWVLVAVGMSIFTITAVFTALVPFVWI